MTPDLLFDYIVSTGVALIIVCGMAIFALACFGIYFGEKDND